MSLVELSTLEKAQSYELNEAVAAGNSVSVLLGLCADASTNFVDPLFPWCLVGTLLLQTMRITDGKEVIAAAKESPLAISLFQSIDSIDLENYTPQLWENIEGFTHWERTSVAKKQRVHILDSLDVLTPSLDLTSDNPLIVDLGPGDGSLTAEIIGNLLAHCDSTHIRLLLIDVSEDALAQASRTCKERFGSRVEIQCVHSAVEAISTEDMLAMFNKMATLVIASATLHHLPATDKADTLNRLLPVTKMLFLSELEGNHDSPCFGSAELIYSVFRFYNCLIGSTLECELSDAEKISCIDNFLVPEAAAILFCEYTKRQNFHCLEREWRSHFVRSGYQIVHEDHRSILSNCPRTLTYGVQ